MGKKTKVVITPKDVGSAAEVLDGATVVAKYADEQKVTDDIVNKVAFENALSRAMVAAAKTDNPDELAIEVTDEDKTFANVLVGNLPQRPEAYLTRWETEVGPIFEQFHAVEAA